MSGATVHYSGLRSGSNPAYSAPNLWIVSAKPCCNLEVFFTCLIKLSPSYKNRTWVWIRLMGYSASPLVQLPTNIRQDPVASHHLTILQHPLLTRRCQEADHSQVSVFSDEQPFEDLRCDNVHPSTS